MAILAGSIPLAALDWREIDPLELSLKTPKVEKDADAEVIFWEVKIEDKVLGGQDLQAEARHYLRIKIYNERGRDSQSTVEIPTFNKMTVIDVAGRTLKANGEVILLKKDAIFDKDLVKSKGLKMKGKSFALPNVEPGDVIEYQYKIVRQGNFTNYERLYLQRDIPMWSVKYIIKPFRSEWLPYGMRTLPFQARNTPFKAERDGFYSTQMDDVPAFKPEPYMPPENQVKSWLLVFYEEDRKLTPEKFWKEMGKRNYQGLKDSVKVDSDVKRVAAEIVSGAETPAQKLDKLETFCRTKIKNATHRPDTVSAEERDSLQKSHKKEKGRTPGDTLKQQLGYSRDINHLFVAMAVATGLEARLTRIGDRGDFFFHSNLMTDYILGAWNVAVKLDDKWKFFDPATPYIENGMLRWGEEGTSALILDPKDGFFVNTPFSGPEKSVKKRAADFTLSEDGTLEGDVRLVYTGHVGHMFKSETDGKSEEERIQYWKESITNRLNSAEVSDIKIFNTTDPAKPLTVTYRLKVPNYATRTGKRVLVQPSFFQFNIEPLFKSETRKHDIYFRYAWKEEDRISIVLPEGWSLDSPTAPQSIPLGDAGDYKVAVRLGEEGRKVIYERTMSWGLVPQAIYWPVKMYPNIKKAWEYIHEQDNHVLTLKTTPSAN